MTKKEIQNKYFSSDEKIIWSGIPNTLKLFMRSDIILIPFTLLIGGFMIYYSYSSMILMLRGQSLTFALTGITFLLIGFYLIFGRIWYRHKRLSKNIYFITDKRVFVFNTLRDNVSLDIPIEYTQPKVVHNTLFLSEKNLFGDILYGLGLDVFFHNVTGESPAFTAINNPEEIKKIINDVQKNRKKVTNDTDNFI